ncbi:MAG: hypothetical protein E5W91_09195 [Mesorhizobium sp.]|nr:MAG: hypothetical protein E5W91_09195 [Mesorhizobium sp.]TIS89028.1 MAG: hypothetical protein E5W89_18625 [Mesorhizobium sp.]
MERVCERQNLLAALKRVRQNAGSPGIDGITVEALSGYLRVHWPRLREELLAGCYQPQPVRRVAIPKAGGGERELGIPTVLDRFIQQALLQVLQPLFDPTFSEASFGFRPGRSAHDAVLRAQAYVQEGRSSVRAGERVMASVERFLDRRLKLKVNMHKSAVASPHRRKFLGFSFTDEKMPRRRIAPQAVVRFKERVRVLTMRTRGASLVQIAKELSLYLKGWRGYFGFCETPSVLRSLDQWIRRRFRSIAWKQWKGGRTRFAELRRRGVGHHLAAQTAGSVHGPWRISNSPALAIALPNAFLAAIGLTSLAPANVA